MYLEAVTPRVLREPEMKSMVRSYHLDNQTYQLQFTFELLNTGIKVYTDALYRDGTGQSRDPCTQSLKTRQQ